MFILSILFGFLFIVVYVLKQSKQRERKKIFGIYSQPGKWYSLKYHLFVLLLFVRRLKYYIFGKSFFHKESEIERLQPLSSHKLAFDAVFFQAVTQDGIYFCVGTERRQEAKVNGLVYFVVPEYGVLLSEKLPKTTLNADPASLLSNKEYAAEGIHITPVVPMKLWKISYKGNMRRLSHPDKFVHVDFQAEWSSDLPWFLFDTDIPVKMIARAIAREPWTEELFKSLKEAHQTHYEQMGQLTGKLQIDGKVIALTEMDAFRDHSFGENHQPVDGGESDLKMITELVSGTAFEAPGYKRDWSLMHRYIFHMLYLSDKTKISVGVVCQPCTSSYLEMGFIVHPNGKLEAIDSCDLLLYQHGENGILNKELCFTFVANGTTYEVKVNYECDVVHYVGNDIEAKMNERFLVCEVNGIPGRGISEWHYNNVKQN